VGARLGAHAVQIAPAPLRKNATLIARVAKQRRDVSVRAGAHAAQIAPARLRKNATLIAHAELKGKEIARVDHTATARRNRAHAGQGQLAPVDTE
jgi:2-oxo-4-hydroxy-4-carboxy--5-ureidoimidazoline (OHCU) decarboxylase